MVHDLDTHYVVADIGLDCIDPVVVVVADGIDQEEQKLKVALENPAFEDIPVTVVDAAKEPDHVIGMNHGYYITHQMDNSPQ